MAASVISNRPSLPFGYRRGVLGLPLTKYLPFNGGGNSPGTIRTGTTQAYAIGSVPADLSTFILNAPNGQSFTFQFVYNASSPSTGITIPLPLSGASTAAQVRAAMAAVLGASGSNNFGGGFQSFPWVFLPLLTANFEIDWKVAGTAVAATGTQATITPGAVVAQSTQRTNLVVPGRFGKNFAWLPAVS
jgi:hypothetical protein